MGKRSEFKRIEDDKYYTHDVNAVIPLIPHLPKKTKFVEPCAGAGHLIKHLERAGHECVGAFDILPEGPGIEAADVLFFTFTLPPCDLIITNPPWDRNPDGSGPLHDMIRRFTEQADTWLLFDAGWMFTGQTESLKHLCRKIVTVGRLNWIPGTKGGGMEDCCWYFFSEDDSHGQCQFYFKQ